LLVLAIMTLIFTSITQQATKVTWQTFTTNIRESQIRKGSIVIKDDGIYADRIANLVSGTGAGRIVYSLTGVDRDFYRSELNTLTKGDFKEQATPYWTQFLIALVPVAIIMFIIWMVVSRSLRSAAGGAGGMLGNFGK